MDDQITDIIARKLQGTASQQDLAELQLWLEASDANRLEFEQMQLIWDKGADLFNTTGFNTGIAWEKVDGAIRRNEKRAMVFPLKRLAIAVAFLGAIFTGWYFWRSGDPSIREITAGNTTRVFNLPDGSTVHLRKGGSLRYAATFNKNIRRIELKGEAWFQVQSDPKQPFLISTENATIRVLGTAFLVHSTDAGDEVIVSSGKVSMSDKQAEEKQVILTAGQKAVLSHGDLLQETVSDSNYLAWKTGILEFRNTPLHDAIAALADYYDLQFFISDSLNPAVQQLNINARFQDQPISEVLEELRLTTGLKITRDQDRIIFSGN